MTPWSAGISRTGQTGRTSRTTCPRSQILVLVEYGLRGHGFAHYRIKGICALILVLMEYGLRVGLEILFRYEIRCLNPCFNGIWSASTNTLVINELDGVVLILVVMEYGLRAGARDHGNEGLLGLILVVMEYGLRDLRAF